MGSGTIFSGSDIKTLKNNLDLNGNAKVLSGSVDPSQTATTAPLGSLYLSTLTGRLYRKKDAGSSTNWERAIGPKAPLIKNYIEFGDFEAALSTGWSLGTVTLTSNLPSGVPTFGSGASGTLSLGVSSSGHLSGLSSLSYSSSGATTAGDFFSSLPITIDISDQMKTLSFRFNYKVISGTPNLSGTSSNSFGVAIYDITNSAWIIPSGCFNLVQLTGVGTCQGSFQTPYNMTQFRVVIYNPNSTAAFQMYLDDFYCGPQVNSNPGLVAANVTGQPPAASANAPIIFPTVIYDNGGLYNTSTGQFKIGTSGIYSISGFLSQTTAGVVSAYVNGSIAQNIGSILATNGLGPISGQISVKSGDLVDIRTSAGTGTFSSGNSSYIALSQLPNSSQSVDSLNRVIGFCANGQPGAVSSGAVIIFPSVLYDDAGAYSTVTGQYKAPISGEYDVSAFFNATQAGLIYNVYVNNSSRISFCQSNATACASGSTTVKVNAGDLIDVRPFGTSTGAFSSNGGQISINLRTGPTVVQASESINVRANGTPAVATSGNPIIFTGTAFDSHNQYNSTTGAYKIPATGVYLISAYLNASAAFVFSAYVNGSFIANMGITNSGGVGNGSALVKCIAGDLVDIRPNASTLSFGANSNLCISRTGN